MVYEAFQVDEWHLMNWKKWFKEKNQQILILLFVWKNRSKFSASINYMINLDYKSW